MVEIFPGSGFQGKPPKPKSLSETFEEIKDIAKGVGIGESFDLAGAPADITDAFFSARKALFPYSDLGEQKAAEKLAQGIGAEALIKKAGVDVPEFGNNLESFGRTIAPGLLIGKTAAGIKLLSRMFEGGLPPTGLAPAGVNDPILIDIPKTTGEKLAMTSADEGIGSSRPPKKGTKNFQEAGEKHVSKEDLPPISAFRGAEIENKPKTFAREKEDALIGFDATQQFFSPTSYFFENSAGLIGFGRKPMKGGEILGRLITNNNVPRAVKREIRSLGLDNYLLRNSEKPFTRDEFLSLLSSVKPQIRVETFSRNEDQVQGFFPNVYFQYPTMQRSTDSYANEKDYGWMVFSDKNSNAFGLNDDADLVIKNEKPSTGASGHDYAGGQDQSPGYFGHIRYSIQEIDGELALVPEEIQSDAVRAAETTSKIMSGSLPLRSRPDRRVSDADRKNLDRAEQYISDEFRAVPLDEQDSFLDSVKDTDRHVTLTKYGGPEEALVIKQAGDSLSDADRNALRDFTKSKQTAFKNRTVSNDKLRIAENTLDQHERSEIDVGYKVDFLDSVESSIDLQKRFLAKLNSYTDESGFNALESAIAPSDALQKKLPGFGVLGQNRKNLLLDDLQQVNQNVGRYFDDKLDKFLGKGAGSNAQKFSRDLQIPMMDGSGTPLLTAGEIEAKNMRLGPHHLNIFDASFDKPKQLALNIFEEVLGDKNTSLGLHFLDNIRLLDPNYRLGAYDRDIVQYMRTAIDVDPDGYVGKMKQVLTKEFLNKTEKELTSALFLKEIFKNKKFVKEIERSRTKLKQIEDSEGLNGGDLTKENVEEMQDILDDALEASFTDKQLTDLSFKLVDESFGRTNFYPKYIPSSGRAGAEFNQLAGTTEEARLAQYEAIDPFIKEVNTLESDLEGWIAAKDPTSANAERYGMFFESKLLHRGGFKGDEIENINEKKAEEFIKTNKNYQRVRAAYELKDAVLGLKKTGNNVLSPQYSALQNNIYYLGMRGTGDVRKGGLHNVLGKFDYVDFSEVRKTLEEARGKAEDVAQEAERVVSTDFTASKIKEAYKPLLDKTEQDDVLEKTLDKIIAYDLGDPGSGLKKQPPFKSMEDFSKFAIRAAVKEAHKLGIKKVIVPTAENYVGNEKVAAIGTYNKAPREAMQEYVKFGGKLTTRKLPEIGYDVKDSNVLDISEIDDKFFTDTSASLFNKGGIVRKAS